MMVHRAALLPTDQYKNFLLIAGCLEDWVTRCSKAAETHNDLVRSEQIMTDKQKKEENGTVPERKG